jgi:hypothetical protein
MVGTLGAGELIPDEAAEEPMPCWVDAIAGLIGVVANEANLYSKSFAMVRDSICVYFQ